MYVTTALISASLALEPPFGGIAPLPLIALAVRPSTPCARRGAQAALSPIFGALATPEAWHVWQSWVYSAGGAPASAPAGSAFATAVAGAAGAAAGVGVTAAVAGAAAGA